MKKKINSFFFFFFPIAFPAWNDSGYPCVSLGKRSVVLKVLRLCVNRFVGFVLLFSFYYYYCFEKLFKSFSDRRTFNSNLLITLGRLYITTTISSDTFWFVYLIYLLMLWKFIQGI